MEEEGVEKTDPASNQYVLHSFKGSRVANSPPVRPNFAKPKPPPELQNNAEDDEPEVLETQAQAHGTSGDHDSDGEESDYASDASHTPRKGKTQQKKATEIKEKTTKDGMVKTAVRKVKATANANYRRLKIKGKGGNGGKGKFGKRR